MLRTFASFVNGRLCATLLIVKEGVNLPDVTPPVESRSQRLFYSLFLPLGIVTNLVLGGVVLSGLKPHGVGWLQVSTGAFCCLIAGWLAAAAWSKSYWNRSMARQISTWRRIADAFFTWLEEVPLPAEALHRLKSSLDEAVPTAKRN
jgi:hypothetical protein